MSIFRLHPIRTPSEMRRVATDWDDLWLRSDVATPVSRAELVALQVEQLGFSSFHGLAVEHDGRFVAAIPLVDRRIKGMVRVGSLPCNCWIAGGALLIDPKTDVTAALDCMMSGIARLPWPMLWLDQVPFGEPAWQAFVGAACRANLSTHVREHYRIGVIDVEHHWNSYLARLKGDHRRKLNRYVRKLQEAGGAELKIYRDLAPDQVDELVHRAFEVEDRSWKGVEGTSVLRNPAVYEHYRREAHVLARDRQLELVFLEQNDRPMAFVYGYFAKGVFYVAKLGYDDEFASFGPGQQLMLRILELFHSDAARRTVDFAGPLVPFHQVWASHSYPVGPLVIAAPNMLGRGLFHAYAEWQPRLKRAREKVSTGVDRLRVAANAVVKRMGWSWGPGHHTLSRRGPGGVD